MDHVIVREARNEDCEAIAEIYYRSWKEAYRGIMNDEFLDELEMKLIKDISAKQNQVALIDKKVVGIINFGKVRHKEEIDEAEIRSLYLLPEYWQKGIGRKLLESAISSLREDGFNQVLLWVLKDNVRARKFYETMGFHLIEGLKQMKIKEQVLDSVCYEKPL